MNVPGDSGALQFQGALPIQELELQLHFAPRSVAHASHQRADNEHEHTTPKPWRLPKRRHHGDWQRNHCPGPLASFGERLKFELVLAWRQVVIATLTRATPADAVHFVPLQNERVPRVND